ncbi:MAG: DUF2339 domain-containing protein [Nitrospirales bacterium]|nr:DUF2339 domain-containing protein [Nitrospirales bacterium]
MEEEKSPASPELAALHKRLDRIEEEISQLRNALSSLGNVPPAQRRPLQKKEITKEKTPLWASSAPGQSLESAIGTKWIGRIGMLAIIVGMGFFLKYAFDNRLIGETGRIILGILSGIGFIGAGEYFQKRKNWTVYGQILTGGGLAILYFSLFAAFAFYHLISQTLAFAAMIAVTTTGITLSVRYSAQSITAIGMLGGFLTPLILSTGENRPIALFSYIFLLDLGIISVVYLRRWKALGVLSLLFTILIYSLWHGRFYTPEQQLTAFCITAIFFLFYNLFVVFSQAERWKNEKDAGLALMVIFISAAFFIASFNEQNISLNDWTMKSFFLAMALIEVLFAHLLARMAPWAVPATLGYAGASLIISVASVFVVLDKSWATAALAAEMVVFTFMGIRAGIPLMRYTGYLLGVILLFRFVDELPLFIGPFENFALFLNSRFFICAFIIASCYGMLFLLSRNRERLTGSEPAMIPAALITTQILSVVLLTREFSDFYDFSASSLPFTEFRYAKQLSLSVLWTLYGSALTGIGIMRKSRLLRLMGIGLMAVTILKVFLFDLSELQAVYRIISFMILGLILLTVSYGYNRFKHRIFGEER